jgi:aspartyl protease family protein
MQHSTKKLGMMFTVSGWILGFLLLGLIFSKVLDHQTNPNQSVATSQSSQFQEIVLERNRYGHYIFDGEINGKPVSFLVDTGATTVSIPTTLQTYLKLEAGPSYNVSTANGIAKVYSTRLDELKMGEILLTDIRAHLNPGLPDDEILLGMEVLKHMEMIQRGDLLIIRQYH